ncbi:MAG: NADH-quinone oxidoreductase subunit L [Firmicutes bacterium]|nr:NADH-quinone oxidoreductase subunit L [Bacillota bacterium]
MGAMFGNMAAFMTGGSGVNLLWLMVVLPVALAVLAVAIPRHAFAARSACFLAATLADLLLAIALFIAKEGSMLLRWTDFEINLAFRVDPFSGAVLLALGIFAVLVAIYSVAFLRRKEKYGQFYCYYLLTLAMANGAVLADNLVVLLFFWEGLMVTLFGMLLIGDRQKPATAVKALVLNGIADLLLMLGVAATAAHAGTFMMEGISQLPIEGLGVLGFVCMMAGAVGKAGAMPFHSWIPDAADAAPLPFMAILPAAFEKILGIYLLVRITFQFYQMVPGSVMSIVVMAIGAITIVLANSMALIQKDIKRLLSYSTISQVGYMILGIGTALPVGIIGGLFHLINHVMYKCCLFLTAGSVEKQTGSTDMRYISGLGKLMPVTTVCFLTAALSISGVPPFSGFFSKELVFDAALESGMIFYIAAVLGAFLTAASFLKLGHAAYFGPLRLPEGVKTEDVKEVPGAMLLPMGILALGCLIFGVFNALPLSVIQPIAGEGYDFSGWPDNWTLVAISCAVLLLAVGNHLFGYRRTGEGLKAADHIRYAPALRTVYDCAEKRYFDPYDIIMQLIKGFAWICYGIDRAINWVYDVFAVDFVSGLSSRLRLMNNGSVGRYMAWSFLGVGFIVLLCLFLV